MEPTNAVVPYQPVTRKRERNEGGGRQVRQIFPEEPSDDALVVQIHAARASEHHERAELLKMVMLKDVLDDLRARARSM